MEVINPTCLSALQEEQQLIEQLKHNLWRKATLHQNSGNNKTSVVGKLGDKIQGTINSNCE